MNDNKQVQWNPRGQCLEFRIDVQGASIFCKADALYLINVLGISPTQLTADGAVKAYGAFKKRIDATAERKAREQAFEHDNETHQEFVSLTRADE